MPQHTARKPEDVRSVETSLTALLDDLGITSAHFAGRGSADLKGFASIILSASRH